MATHRKIPAKIMIIDHIGMNQVDHQQYLKRAEAELSKIEQQVARGSLDQGVRRGVIGDNVTVECTVIMGETQAVVTIGSSVGISRLIEPCYCCSPCLVAGKIMTLMADKDPADEHKWLFEEEDDYYADVMICQATGSEEPQKVTVYERRTSGATSRTSEKVEESQWINTQMMRGVIFSDYQNHQEGDVVLVLVQPLYDFQPAPYGVFSGCINRRRIADESVQDAKPTIATDFLESTGMSCLIAKDRAVWDTDIETEEVEESEISKYYPFRVLPIKIQSCL